MSMSLPEKQKQIELHFTDGKYVAVGLNWTVTWPVIFRTGLATHVKTRDNMFRKQIILY
jgi:hypothetical protein